MEDNVSYQKNHRHNYQDLHKKRSFSNLILALTKKVMLQLEVYFNIRDSFEDNDLAFGTDWISKIYPKDDRLADPSIVEPNNKTSTPHPALVQ